jgi:hypothetical protein
LEALSYFYPRWDWILEYNQFRLSIESLKQAPIKSLQAKINIVEGETVMASNDESDDMM